MCTVDRSRLKRRLPRLLIVWAVILAGGFTASGALAQAGRDPYPASAGQPAGPTDLLALFKRPAVPVRLLGLTGPDTLRAGEPGIFAASTNIDAASLPLRVRWDFGDGVAVTSLHARHCFSAPGRYAVVLHLANAYGEASDTLYVTVLPNPDPLAESAPRKNTKRPP